jgi:hypothetical protein
MMTSRSDTLSSKLCDPDEQIHSEFRIICDCGGFLSVAADSKGLAKDRFRALGWRFDGTHRQRWLCPACEGQRIGEHS